MKANFDIWDFKLSRADMDAMALIDQRHFLENHHTAAGLERLLQK
jgi:oxidoreductase, aldo/keto reductase family protein